MTMGKGFLFAAMALATLMFVLSLLMLLPALFNYGGWIGFFAAPALALLGAAAMAFGWKLFLILMKGK